MARKTVRVDIPSRSPDSLIKLGGAIVEKNNDAGTTRKLQNTDVTDLNQKTTDAEKLRKQAAQLNADAQKLNDAADLLLGTAAGQTYETPGTVLYYVTGVRDELLNVNRGNESTLEGWGFDVVIGTAASPQRKSDAPETK